MGSSPHSTQELVEIIDHDLRKGGWVEQDGERWRVNEAGLVALQSLVEQLEASQKALADAVDVAIWLTGLPCLNPESEAWSYWESGARPKLYKAMELLDSNPASSLTEAARGSGLTSGNVSNQAMRPCIHCNGDGCEYCAVDPLGDESRPVGRPS